jgi:hypothetical protein
MDISRKNTATDPETEKLRRKAGGWKDDFIAQRAIEEAMATLWV